MRIARIPDDVSSRNRRNGWMRHQGMVVAVALLPLVTAFSCTRIFELHARMPSGYNDPVMFYHDIEATIESAGFERHGSGSVTTERNAKSGGVRCTQFDWPRNAQPKGGLQLCADGSATYRIYFQEGPPKIGAFSTEASRHIDRLADALYRRYGSDNIEIIRR